MTRWRKYDLVVIYHLVLIVLAALICTGRIS